MDIQDNIIKEQYCQIHPGYRIEYLQINGFENNKNNQSLFYCAECTENDPNFKIPNYISFFKVIKSQESGILNKWPPLNENKNNRNHSIYQKLEQIINFKNTMKKSLQHRIQEYFIDLKKQILNQIDIAEKNMIEKANEPNKDYIKFIQSYQDISKIDQLQQIFSYQNKLTHINEKEKQYKSLLDRIKSNSSNITQELNQILQSFTSFYQEEQPLKMKQQILNNIHQINFFQDQISLKKLKDNLISELIVLDDNFKINENNQKIMKSKDSNYINIVHNDNSSDDFVVTVSDLILNPAERYIFKIELQPGKYDSLCWICIRFEDSPQEYLYDIDLKFIQENQEISCEINEDFKQLKGNGFQLSKENEVEIRICLNEGIYQLLDYPGYKYQIGITDDNISELSLSNQRLSFTIMNQVNSMKIILKQAFTVLEYP